MSIDKNTKLIVIAVVILAVIGIGYWALRPKPIADDEEPIADDVEPIADDVGPTGAPIKIGMFVDTTGTAATQGLRMVSAARMALEIVNEEGGVLGRPLELIARDTASDALTAIAAMRRLVEVDRVHILNGPHWSSCCLPCLPVSDELGIPWINTASTHRKLGESGGVGGNRWFFHTKLIDYWFFSSYLDILVNEVGAKTFIGVFRNDDWGHQCRDIISDYLTQYGGELIEDVYFEPGETNYMPILTRIKDLKPDGIIPVGPTVDFVRQWSELGLSDDIPLFWRSFTFFEWRRLLGEEILEGIWGVDQYTAVIDTSENRAFVNEFYNRYGVYPTANDGLVYEGVHLMAQAIEEAGSTDPDAIHDALENIEFLSPLTGWTITFDEYHNGSGLIQIYNVQDGEPLMLYSTNTDEITLG